jgi:hypothetical protein
MLDEYIFTYLYIINYKFLKIIYDLLSVNNVMFYKNIN